MNRTVFVGILSVLPAMGSNLILVGKDILCYTELHSQIYSQTEKGSFHVSNSKKTKLENSKSKEEMAREITREEIKRNRLIALGILIAAAAGIFIYIKYTAYIGYYLALFAIPYGAYGLFMPYKSARLYAKKGYAITYSRQMGTLIVSLGVLCILYSRLYAYFDQTRWFLIALLVYLTLFYFAMSLLNKRYMTKPKMDSKESR